LFAAAGVYPVKKAGKMDCRDVVFKGHAIQRMFERGINEAHVLEVLHHGEQIKDYVDDSPFPSVLLPGYIGGSALHVVLGIDPDIWRHDFRGRQK
jgi:hypothetical protein